MLLEDSEVGNDVTGRIEGKDPGACAGGSGALRTDLAGRAGAGPGAGLALPATGDPEPGTGAGR